MGKTDYGISVSPDGKSLIITIPIETTYRFIEVNNNREDVNLNQLTAREQQVFQLLCRGLRDKEIGKALNLATRTVKFHLGNIYIKMHMHRPGILKFYGTNEDTPRIQ